MTSAEKAEAAKQRLRATLKANPDLAKAFRETLDELSEPENIEKMAAEIGKGMKAIKEAGRRFHGTAKVPDQTSRQGH